MNLEQTIHFNNLSKQYISTNNAVWYNGSGGWQWRKMDGDLYQSWANNEPTPQLESTSISWQSNKMHTLAWTKVWVNRLNKSLWKESLQLSHARLWYGKGNRVKWANRLNKDYEKRVCNLVTRGYGTEKGIESSRISLSRIDPDLSTESNWQSMETIISKDSDA